MKFLFALMNLMALASASKNPIYGGSKANKQTVMVEDEISASSKLGQKIMSKARRLENNNNGGDVDFTWVQNYSIKFQGCHHISQWNDDANDMEDVRIATKRLVRFRLCPSNSCSLENAGGCSSGYGDYVIDMNVYLEAYLESTQNYNEARCEYLEAMSGCENNGDENQDYCLYDYYVANGVEDICADENPYQNNYNGNDGQNNFDIADYTECVQADLQNNNNNNNNRRLDQQWNVEYYMGPYCAEQGGAIFLGLFTDDSCTTFADDYGGKETYYTLTGRELPYSEKNMITQDCYKCMEPEAQYNYEGNDNNDGDNVNEMCETIYAQAGKCENNLDAYGVYPNYNACSYIQGIQVIRKNGVIVSNANKANRSASIFIGIFVVAFVLLSAYVYYLKTKLDRASISLNSDS